MQQNHPKLHQCGFWPAFGDPWSSAAAATHVAAGHNHRPWQGTGGAHHHPWSSYTLPINRKISEVCGPVGGASSRGTDPLTVSHPSFTSTVCSKTSRANGGDARFVYSTTPSGDNKPHLFCDTWGVCACKGTTCLVIEQFLHDAQQKNSPSSAVGDQLWPPKPRARQNASQPIWLPWHSQTTPQLLVGKRSHTTSNQHTYRVQGFSYFLSLRRTGVVMSYSTKDLIYKPYSDSNYCLSLVLSNGSWNCFAWTSATGTIRERLQGLLQCLARASMECE